MANNIDGAQYDAIAETPTNGGSPYVPGTLNTVSLASCMTREESWCVYGVTRALLRQIASLGYTVSVHRIPSSLLGSTGAFLGMHAIDLRSDPLIQKIARIGLAEGGDTDYRCACLLATSVGIDLADG